MRVSVLRHSCISLPKKATLLTICIPGGCQHHTEQVQNVASADGRQIPSRKYWTVSGSCSSFLVYLFCMLWYINVSKRSVI